MEKLYLSGAVGEDFTAATIQDALPQSGEPVHVILSSPGGYVSDGFEIRNVLRDHSKENTLELSGVVASMGAYISTAFKKDNITAKDNAAFMFHNAWGVAIGDRRSMITESGILSKFDNLQAEAYSRQTGKSKEEILEAMSAGSDNSGTWLTGKEIVDYGFAGSLEDTGEDISRDDLVAVARDKYKGLKLSYDKAAASYRKVAKLLEEQPTKPKDKTMDEKSVFEWLNTKKENGEMSLSKIAKAMNLDSKLITDDQRAALASFDAVKDALGNPENLEDTVKAMAQQIEDDKQAVRKAALDEAFGLEKDEAGKVNFLRVHAERIEEATPEAIEAFKKDPVAIKLAGEKADYSQNELGALDGDDGKIQVKTQKVVNY